MAFRLPGNNPGLPVFPDSLYLECFPFTVIKQIGSNGWCFAYVTPKFQDVGLVVASLVAFPPKKTCTPLKINMSPKKRPFQ